MAITAASELAFWETKYADLKSQYTALTSSANVSDQGRSITNGATAKSIMEQMEYAWKMIVSLQGPAFVTSRMRA